MNKTAVVDCVERFDQKRERRSRKRTAPRNRGWLELAQLRDSSFTNGNYVDNRAGILVEREAAILDTIAREPLQLHYVLVEDGTLYEAGGAIPPNQVIPVISSVRETLEVLLRQGKIKTANPVECYVLEVAAPDGETDDIWSSEVALHGKRLMLA